LGGSAAWERPIGGRAAAWGREDGDGGEQVDRGEEDEEEGRGGAEHPTGCWLRTARRLARLRTCRV
jgi:hypothetical protein